MRILRRPALVVFLSSLLATAACWLLLQPAFLSVSPSGYAQLNGDYQSQVTFLITGAGAFSARYPPVFPLLLGALYHGAVTLHVPLGVALGTFIALCTSAGCVLVYLLAARVWGAGRASLIAALLWSWYIVPLWLTTYPSPETPFIPLLVGGVLAFVSALDTGRRMPARMALAGMLIGVAMLIRPIALGVGIVLALLLWRFARHIERKRRALLVVLLLGANGIAVLPWEVWMHRRYQKVIPLSTGGVASTLDGLTYAVDPSNHRNVEVPDAVEALQLDMLARQNVELNSMSSIGRYLADEAVRRPVAVLELLVIKAGNAWYATDSARYDKYVLLLQVIFLSLVLLGTWSAWKRGGQPRRLAIIVWSITLWFWIMTITVLSIARYMTPVMALLVTLVPGALLELEGVAARGLRRYPATARTTAESSGATLVK